MFNGEYYFRHIMSSKIFKGLGSIRVDGFDPSSAHNVTIPPFSVGTTDVVGVVFHADCCVRKVGLTVFDVAGNVNATSFDQGPLKGRIQFRLLLPNLS